MRKKPLVNEQLPLLSPLASTESLQLDYLEFGSDRDRQRMLTYSKSPSWESVFCKYHIRNSAIIGAIQKATGVILMKTKSKSRWSPLGFLIYRVLPWPNTTSRERVMYVDIICSKHSGKQMMIHVMELAKQRYHCQYAMLYALPQVMPYYRRLGFRHRYPPMKPMSQCALHESGPVRYHADKIESERVDTMEDALDHSDYRRLIRTLIREQLSADRACASESDPVRACSIFGFVMSKCI
jgi:hypothetical protein